MESVESGCFAQHSQLDRLREVADLWVRDRLSGAGGEPAGFPVSLVILGADQLIPEISELHMKGSAVGELRRGLAERPAYSRLLLLECVRRVLHTRRPTAAALLVRLSEVSLALQLADLDHEQSLTTQVVKRPGSAPTIGKWDFATVSWAVRLRPLLRAIPRAAEERVAARPLLRPVAERLPALVSTGANRDEHIRELREQLGAGSSPAPSWLQ